MHGGNALIPTRDDLLLADAEAERLAAVTRAVELGAFDAIGIKPAGVMNADGLACLRLRPVPTTSSEYCRPDAMVTTWSGAAEAVMVMLRAPARKRAMRRKG